MSKGWFWGLLLVNVLFFAAMRWGAELTTEPEATLTQPPLHAERIVLLDESASAPAAAASSAVAETQAVAPHLSTELAAARRCLYWGEFSGSGLQQVRTELDKLELGERLQMRIIEHNSGFWVYMPPQRNMSMVQRKIDQLKKLGVQDYFVVQEAGEWQHAISLGVFRTQQAAESYLETLRKQGVRTAKVSERKSRLRFTLFVIADADDGLAAKLQAYRKDFPDSELKMADCN
ncbi:MAG: SPOR domain-containing protein [Pseudomonadota bacterium]